METINFTKVLNEKPNIYLFNPSISHLKDDLYLCVYRKYVRYPKINQKGDDYDYTKDKLSDPNHPWLGGNHSSTWWQSGYGGDSSKIVLLQIKQERVQLVREYEDMYGVDARLLKISENDEGSYFILSYNHWLKDENQIIKNNVTCKNGCMLIAAKIIFISNTHDITYKDEVFLCPEISNTTEKNWSFWVYGNKLRFSYGLYPDHDVYNMHIENCKIECDNKIMSDPVYMFQSLRRYYNNKLHISVTTPAIEFVNKYFIGVGHVKWDYNNLNEFPEHSYLVKYTNNMLKNGKTNHPSLMYLMFFYIFCPITGTVVCISNMFSPRSHSSLCFPSGLSKTNSDNYIVSYGDSDASCNYFIISCTQIIKMLHEVPTNKQQTYNPQNINFVML